jgi:DNA polymerase-3 subunit delta
VGKYIAQAKKFTLKQLKEAMNDCIEADNSVKTGITDDKYAAELIILKYCSL